MFHKNYSNFVKPISSETPLNLGISRCNKLDGEQAKRLYLEEVGNVRDTETKAIIFTNNCTISKGAYNNRCKRKLEDIDTSNTNLFMSAQNNDVSTLKEILDIYPNKISTVDEFGWSLLMIACQANSIEVVKELLKRGIDTSVRDKAGNSARTLVIKNKNFILAEILLNTNKNEVKCPRNIPERLKEEYMCDICNKVFPDKQEHLSSTVHNINSCKNIKKPSTFIIPPSNIGYQIMIKEGWDNVSGLGRDGSGNKYPVKAVQKLDRKGLGSEKKKSESKKEVKYSKSKKKRDHHENRTFEINFRREFY